MDRLPIARWLFLVLFAGLLLGGTYGVLLEGARRRFGIRGIAAATVLALTFWAAIWVPEIAMSPDWSGRRGATSVSLTLASLGFALLPATATLWSARRATVPSWRRQVTTSVAAFYAAFVLCLALAVLLAPMVDALFGT